MFRVYYEHSFRGKQVYFHSVDKFMEWSMQLSGDSNTNFFPPFSLRYVTKDYDEWIGGKISVLYVSSTFYHL